MIARNPFQRSCFERRKKEVIGGKEEGVQNMHYTVEKPIDTGRRRVHMG